MSPDVFQAPRWLSDLSHSSAWGRNNSPSSWALADKRPIASLLLSGQYKTIYSQYRPQPGFAKRGHIFLVLHMWPGSSREVRDGELRTCTTEYVCWLQMDHSCAGQQNEIGRNSTIAKSAGWVKLNIFHLPPNRATQAEVLHLKLSDSFAVYFSHLLSHIAGHGNAVYDDWCHHQLRN